MPGKFQAYYRSRTAIITCCDYPCIKSRCPNAQQWARGPKMQVKGPVTKGDTHFVAVEWRVALSISEDRPATIVQVFSPN